METQDEKVKNDDLQEGSCPLIKPNVETNWETFGSKKPKETDSQAICINTVRNALKRLNLPMRRAKPNIEFGDNTEISDSFAELEQKSQEQKEQSKKAIKEIREKLNTARDNYSFASRHITSIDIKLRKLSEELDTAKETKNNDEIRINNFKEDMAVHAVFKRLNPTCCPHCEKPIDKKKIKEEKISHHCAICDSELLESEDSKVLLAEFDLNLKASEEAFNEIQKEYNLQYNKHSQLEISLLQLQKQIEQYESEIEKFSERNDIEKRITRLQILKEEYTVSQEKPINHEIKEKPIDEKKIVTKAIEITKGRFEELQRDLLAEVSNEILRISKLVGLENIESIELTSTPHLLIRKDGSETSYSKVSEGEKLRLKVITTIALLSVAEKRKVGRHPGLLLIDSPGAQEVSDNDVNSLIEGLKTLTQELPFLQIIIASRATDVILNHINENHRKHAKGDEFLW